MPQRPTLAISCNSQVRLFDYFNALILKLITMAVSFDPFYPQCRHPTTIRKQSEKKRSLRGCKKKKRLKKRESSGTVRGLQIFQSMGPQATDSLAILACKVWMSLLGHPTLKGNESSVNSWPGVSWLMFAAGFRSATNSLIAGLSSASMSGTKAEGVRSGGG